VDARADRDRAVRAAVAVAAANGLTGVEPRVLADGSNVLVHLAPAPVVARVAAATALARAGAATFSRDLAVAAHLVSAGVPVVAPSAELPPGPHRRDGRALSFWTFVRHEAGAVGPAEFAGLLAGLHAALRTFPGDLPAAPPLDVAPIAARLRGHPIAPDALLADLLADAERLTAELAASPLPRQALHGDAHPGNLLHTPGGPVWTDFEDTWRGPVAWDLACLAHTGRLAGRAAVAAYPDRPDPALLRPFLAARRVQGVAWSLLFAARDPDRWPATERWLAGWRAER
jgi:aminoglycoside phosphotransferase (APT) family kinase protein